MSTAVLFWGGGLTAIASLCFANYAFFELPAKVISDDYFAHTGVRLHAEVKLLDVSFDWKKFSFDDIRVHFGRKYFLGSLEIDPNLNKAVDPSGEAVGYETTDMLESSTPPQEDVAPRVVEPPTKDEIRRMEFPKTAREIVYRESRKDAPELVVRAATEIYTRVSSFFGAGPKVV